MVEFVRQIFVITFVPFDLEQLNSAGNIGRDILRTRGQPRPSIPAALDGECTPKSHWPARDRVPTILGPSTYARTV